ncbi:MAG TPA: hypothetical protein PKW04_11710 [Novosphingobium sp.]|nr:hypothetical protein [Novosphingobium sp.]
MPADAARLRRLHRLEKVRAIARQTAAREAAEAEGTLAQLRALAERTAQMAEGYRAKAGPALAQDLRQMDSFAAGLRGISHATSGDADRARSFADRKQQALAQAERARSAVAERAEAEARAIALRRQQLALGARRSVGTGLE